MRDTRMRPVAQVVHSRPDKINHCALFQAPYSLCLDVSYTSGNTGKHVVIFDEPVTCEKCIKACRELITTLQACIAGSAP